MRIDSNGLGICTASALMRRSDYVAIPDDTHTFNYLDSSDVLPRQFPVYYLSPSSAWRFFDTRLSAKPGYSTLAYYIRIKGQAP